MKVVHWKDFIKGSLKASGSAAMTIGVFDGIHMGHQYIFNNIINHDSEISIVLTFVENPRLFFKDNTYPGDIFTISQKLKTLTLMGIDIVILIDFSSDFSKLSGKDFLFLIADNCDISYLSLGQNFRCGKYGRTSSYEAREILKSRNIPVNIEKMTYFNDQLVSSTLIRKAILSGNLKTARNMLERVFSLDIADIPQIIREKTIIIETKNIKQVLPPQGHYVVRIGNSNITQESEVYFNASEIVIPLHTVQKLDYIKF
ncbi:MAG: FAD synthetase family protein [Spirochaetales bacterium]|nr:FAD synthetase family protein [Spirochaetales bacterium]